MHIRSGGGSAAVQVVLPGGKRSALVGLTGIYPSKTDTCCFFNTDVLSSHRVYTSNHSLLLLCNKQLRLRNNWSIEKHPKFKSPQSEQDDVF